jgi:hypothetical protein
MRLNALPLKRNLLGKPFDGKNRMRLRVTEKAAAA